MHSKKFKTFYFWLLPVLILNNCSGPIVPSITKTNPTLSIFIASTSNASFSDQSFSTITPVQAVKTSTPVPSETPTFVSIKTAINTQTPTVTATTDFSRLTIQTVTPGPAAQCIQENSGATPTLPFIKSKPGSLFNYYVEEDDILDFLNKYGIQVFWSELKKSGSTYWPISIQAYRDLTNDGFPELAVGAGLFYIFGCKDGHYVTLYKMEPDAYLDAPRIISIVDANRNDLPEITLLLGFESQGGHSYQVLEWDGDNFQNVLISGYDWWADSIFVEAPGDLVYADIDHDGFREYIANIGIPVWETYELGIPWRQEKQIYKWNGKQFVFLKSIFSPPEYRFQAVQDGDRAAREGDYKNALNSYQLAIYNDKLGWWSPDRREYVRKAFFDSFVSTRATPTPILPLPDIEEYDNLAAYSRYRIMLLDLSRGWVSDAKVIYETIQNKYPDGKTGYVYASLAENVWKEFLYSGDLGKACKKALDFASNNKDDVFYYISGSGFPGNHGINYETDPIWICPYKSSEPEKRVRTTTMEANLEMRVFERAAGPVDENRVLHN